MTVYCSGWIGISRSKIKVLLVVFFDWKGTVHHEFAPCGQMVNKQLYQEVLAHLRDDACRKRPKLWENQTWMSHHDNAPAHALLLIRSYLAKHQTSVVPHPPYSLDLAPADVFRFPKLKTTLKERFQTTEDIQKNAIRELRTITESAFQEAFQQ
jgi:transposase